MNLTVAQLRSFLAVAEHEHFGRAADALGVSQPTVSKDLARLERSLGVALARRSTRAMTLTAAGAELVAPARAVVDALGEFQRHGRRLARAESGAVRIVASPSLVDGLLPEVLSRLEREPGAPEVQAIAVDTGAVERAVASEDADLGVGHFVTEPPGYTARVIGRDEIVGVVTAGHAAAGSLDLAGLADLPLLLWPREQAPEYFDALLAICQERGLDPFQLVSPPRIGGERIFTVREGRAFALLPRAAAGRLGAGVRLLPLSPPAWVPVVLLQREAPAPSARAVAEVVTAAARADREATS